MLTDSQVKIIDAYVSENYFDTEKLKKYLNTHDVVGNEVFSYCEKSKAERNDELRRTYASYLDDEYGFNPLPVDKFVRRVPFYFFVPCADDDHPWRGRLEYALRSIETEHGVEPPEPELLEKLYSELEYMFYDVEIPLNSLFSYLTDQTGLVTGPTLQWADYLHICEELGWDDYYPESFISKYNQALEAVGREPVVYEVDMHPWSDDYFYRNGDTVEFRGMFPMDAEGNPVLRWTNVRVKNAESITCNQEKSKWHCTMTVKLSPKTVIYGFNMYSDWKRDCLYQMYAGPLFMEFNYMSIKNKRKKLGYTQQQVADAIGTTVRTYQKWESGETTPDGHYLLRLMNWLDMPDPQYIISYTEGDED